MGEGGIKNGPKNSDVFYGRLFATMLEKLEKFIFIDILNSSSFLTIFYLRDKKKQAKRHFIRSLYKRTIICFYKNSNDPSFSVSAKFAQISKTNIVI